tara:strand:- start:998 stop:1135 length:138 start_codon:yes stop_codon:yes gene_type:complete
MIYPKPEEEEQKKAEREESWRTVEPSRMEPKFSREQEVLYQNISN